MPKPSDEYVSDWPTKTPEAPEPDRDGSPIMGDGQVGGTLLNEGPEGSNPEGSEYINDKQYWDRTNPRR